MSAVLNAETIKMKDGNLISGSIVAQTEYTLNLATSYGTITLNQREIEQILPDKHRLVLKGGTQLIGVILDLDEFNLKLQTDEGAVVNVDMPQIVSIENYDYNQGKEAQKEYVEENIERQQAAQAAAQTAKSVAQTGKVEAAGGLTFDSDIDQVFGAQNATVVNGKVVTPEARIQQTAPQKITDEEAFIKGTTNAQAVSVKTEEKPKPAKKKTKFNEKNFSKYFSIQAGAMPLDLQASGTISLGDSYNINLGDEKLDVGGTSPIVTSSFLWRIKESNLWLGPSLSMAGIANNKFQQPGIEASSSGRILKFGAKAQYYLTPQNRFSFYLAADASYEMLTLNYRGEISMNTGGSVTTLPFRDSVKSNGFAGAVGIGVETWVDDVMLGLEARQVFAQRTGALKESATANTVIQAQLSWKFE
jgi:hypothetical protein